MFLYLIPASSLNTSMDCVGCHEAHLIACLCVGFSEDLLRLNKSSMAHTHTHTHTHSPSFTTPLHTHTHTHTHTLTISLLPCTHTHTHTHTHIYMRTVFSNQYSWLLLHQEDPKITPS